MKRLLQLVFTSLLVGMVITSTYSQQWYVLENESFIISYPPGYEEDAKETLNCAIWAQKQTMKMYPHILGFKVNIYLNESLKMNEPVALAQSGSTEGKIFILRPSWKGSWGGYEQLDCPFRRVLNHEYVHIPFYKDLYSKSSLSGGYSDPPSWFSQGVAEYISQNYLPSYEERVKDSIQNGSFYINEEYSWGLYIVEYLYIQYGQAKVIALIKSTAPTFSDALEKELGMSPRDFEQGWQEYLSQRFLIQQSSATVSISPKNQEIKISEKGNISIEIEAAKNLAGFQLDLKFNPKILDFEKAAEGRFLKNGQGQISTFWKEPSFDKEAGILILACARIAPRGAEGNGILAQVLFKPKEKGESVVEISSIVLSDSKAQNITVKTIPGKINVLTDMPWDVNKDGEVNIFDLVLIGQNFGNKTTEGPKDGDVNSDGLVDVFDLVLVGKHFGEKEGKAPVPF